MGFVFMGHTNFVLIFLVYHRLLCNLFKTRMHSQRTNLRRSSAPIRRIRISDFGLPDPKRDPDRHQNCVTWSLSHALPLQKISSKSVHKFASNPTDRQTDKQTELKT